MSSNVRIFEYYNRLEATMIQNVTSMKPLPVKLRFPPRATVYVVAKGQRSNLVRSEK